MRALCASLAALVAAPALAEPIPVPSGIEVTRYEIRHDTLMGDLWLRFRYIAPRIGQGAGAVTIDVVEIDIDYLCDNDAVPHILETGLDPHRIVVSLSDRAVEFGTSDPTATQFFGSYRLDDTRCIWEEF